MMKLKPTKNKIAWSLSASIIALLLIGKEIYINTINNNKEIEAISQLDAITKMQMAFHFDNNKFSNRLQNLSTPDHPLNLTGENYKPHIIKADNKETIILAASKKGGLSSYLGVVAYTGSKENYQTILCKSDRPYPKITFPLQQGKIWQCVNDLSQYLNKS